jgi:hypothetical protein
MSYPILTLKAARIAYDQLAQSVEPAWADIEAIRGSGPPKDYYPLRDEASVICEQFKRPLVGGQAAKFEGQIGIMLHENVTDIDAAGDPDFWRWLAMRPLLNTTLFRHQEGVEMPKAFNFGIGLIVENFAFRSWIRAEMGYDAEASPAKRYSLALRGDQDLWRSHLMRVRYSFHRPMAQALIEFQFPSDDSDGVLEKGPKPGGIRMLAKRLQRTQANLAYPVLSKEQCSCLIQKLAVGLKRTDGATFMSTGAR